MLRALLVGFCTVCASHVHGQAPPAGEEQKLDAPKMQLPPGRSLSEKLDKSDGVIKPSGNVDPKIAKHAPAVAPQSTPI